MVDIEKIGLALAIEAEQLALDVLKGRPATAQQALRLKELSKQLLGGYEIRGTVKRMTELKTEAAFRQAQSKGFVHPFQSLLKAHQMSLNDAAARLGVMLAVAKGWTRAKQTRPISRAVADKAAKLWGFRATSKNWPNGIRD